MLHIPPDRYSVLVPIAAFAAIAIACLRARRRRRMRAEHGCAYCGGILGKHARRCQGAGSYEW